MGNLNTFVNNNKRIIIHRRPNEFEDGCGFGVGVGPLTGIKGGSVYYTTEKNYFTYGHGRFLY